MTDEVSGETIYSGDLVDLINEEIETLQGIQDELSYQHEYFVYQRELLEINNSISLAILVFVGACLGALIFRHLRK